MLDGKTDEMGRACVVVCRAKPGMVFFEELVRKTKKKTNKDDFDYQLLQRVVTPRTKVVVADNRCIAS